MPLSNFVPGGFGFVHHSIAILYHEVPDPTITIRNFFVAVHSSLITHHSPRVTSRRSDLEAAYQQVLPVGSQSLDTLLGLLTYACVAGWPPAGEPLPPHVPAALELPPSPIVLVGTIGPPPSPIDHLIDLCGSMDMVAEMAVGAPSEVAETIATSSAPQAAPAAPSPPAALAATPSPPPPPPQVCPSPSRSLCLPRCASH